MNTNEPSVPASELNELLRKWERVGQRHEDEAMDTGAEDFRNRQLSIANGLRRAANELSDLIAYHSLAEHDDEEDDHSLRFDVEGIDY